MKKTIILLILSSLCLITMTVSAIPNVTTWQDYSTIHANFESLVTEFPSLVTHEVIGQTVNGQDIWMYKIGNPNGGKVMFDGAMHGNEVTGSELCWQLAVWLLTQQDPAAIKILEKNLVLIVPVVNIDKFYWYRYNVHCHDINRDFQWPGGYSSMLSEPESQAIYNVWVDEDPYWYISFHTSDNRITPPWGCVGCGVSVDADYFQQVANNISAICVSRGTTSIPYVTVPEYAAHGLARDGAYALGIYNYCVEIPTWQEGDIGCYGTGGYMYPPISGHAYSTIVDTYTPKAIGILIGITDECAISDPPVTCYQCQQGVIHSQEFPPLSQCPEGWTNTIPMDCHPIPGFELVFLIIAIGLVLYLRRKK
jgi:hypothetical protein